MVDKKDDVDIVNTKNNKENMKINMRNHVCSDSLYIYVHTYNN